MSDDSSLCLSTKMVEISRVEARVFFLDKKMRKARLGNLNPKRGTYMILTRLK